MPLTLPLGVLATPAGDPDLLTGPRSSLFSFDLLGYGEYDNTGASNETPLGPLTGVLPSGSITWSASSSIKGGGTMKVADKGQQIDWLNVRIRPNSHIVGPNGTEIITPLGIFLPTAPTESWSDTGRIWNIELLDKSSILDQDIVGDALTGTAPTYSLPTGSNVITAIVNLIEGSGESAVTILPDADAVLSGPMTWDAGTTRLKVINDLLSTANYFSLWVDAYGQFQCTKYQAPQYRAVKFLTLKPFTSGPTSVVSPDWDKDVDIYSVPNRVIGIQQGDGEAAGLIATATNTNPDSPYSYPNRHRWITKVYDAVEAVDEDALNSYVQQRLAALTSVTGGASIKHLLMPGLRVNDVIQFTNSGMDALCTVGKLELPFDPLGLCTTDLTEVVIT